jgi:prepilin-type N-terminal cleavage/methylation domain-containing protein
MCILLATCRKNKDHGLTLTEIIVVLVILVVLISIAGTGLVWQVERKAVENAKIFLNLSWQAEQNYFAWKNIYTQDWDAMDIDNPNKVDNYYDYSIDKATALELIIKATRRNKNSGFAINESGNISDF